jgi:hypothetical protein
VTLRPGPLPRLQVPPRAAPPAPGALALVGAVVAERAAPEQQRLPAAAPLHAVLFDGHEGDFLIVLRDLRDLVEVDAVAEAGQRLRRPELHGGQHVRAGVAGEEEEHQDRRHDGGGGDYGGQPAHGAAEEPLVLSQATGADLLLRKRERGPGRIRFDLQVEQQAAVQRQEQVDDEQHAERQAGGVDGRRHHQQQRQHDQLSVVPVGALLPELDQLQQDEELPDHEHRRHARARQLASDVKHGADGEKVRGEPGQRAEAAALDEPRIEQHRAAPEHPDPRRLGRQREARHAEQHEQVERGSELADVVHG